MLSPDDLAKISESNFENESGQDNIVQEVKKTSAILLIGHGSRAPGANDAQYRVAQDLRNRAGYLVVECAFMEINQPDIPTSLTVCRHSGARRIVVIPYFLHMGTHVQRDLPGIIGEWWADNPEIEIVEGSPLGYSSKITELVEERIQQALNFHSPK